MACVQIYPGRKYVLILFKKKIWLPEFQVYCPRSKFASANFDPWKKSSLLCASDGECSGYAFPDSENLRTTLVMYLTA